MKVRIISAAVGIILLLGVVFSELYVFEAVVLAVSAFSAFEYGKALKFFKTKFIAVVFILAPPVFSLSFLHLQNLAPIIVCAYIFILSLAMIWEHEKWSFADISKAVFIDLLLSAAFSFLIMMRSLENGTLYVWMVFIGAFVSDTAAYFVGRFLGKKKLIPSISPNKTVAGSIGGFIGSAIGLTIFGGINDFNVLHMIILGVMCSFAGQTGDLFASAIKREASIKDFGNIMPGHGGIADRLDSVIFVAPIILFYAYLIR